MKPLSEMTDKEFDQHLKTIIPHLPIWSKDGAVVTGNIETDFVDRNGNRARISTVLWKDKKGNLKESIARVRWEEI